MRRARIVILAIMVFVGSIGFEMWVWPSAHAAAQTIEVRDRFRVVYDKVQGRIRTRALLVPKQQFGFEKATELAREFLDSSHTSVLAELLVGYDQHDLETSRLGTVPRPESEPSFCDTIAQLRQGYPQSGQPISALARVITVGDASLFSYREAGFGDPKHSGVQESILAGGRDPTIVVLAGGQYRLLTFASKGQGNPLSLVLFFKSVTPPSCSACEELTRRFKNLTDARDVEVQIRMDSWFSDVHFPLFFRFEPDNRPVTYEDGDGRIAPPKPAQYYKTPHTICNLNGGAFTCDAYGRYDHVP